MNMKKRFLKVISAFIVVLMIVLSVPSEAFSVLAADIVAEDSIVLDEVKDVELHEGNGFYSVLSFTPDTSGNYIFFSMADIDTVGWIYDEIGTQLKYNDDGGEGNNFRITCYMNAGETYYLRSGLYSEGAAIIPVSVEKMADILSVEFDDVTLIEYYDSDTEEIYDEENDSWEQWERYQYSWVSGTLYYADGTSVTFEDHYSDNGEYWPVETSDTQSYDTPWLAGNTYTASGTLFGFTNTFNVRIVENPVESLTVSDVTIIEGSGYDEPVYDEFGNECTYHRYNYNPEWTVAFDDGRTETFYNYEPVVFEGRDFYLSVWDEQSYENQWGIGKHTAHASIMGFETDYSVEIVESPIENILVEDISIMLGTGGEYDYDLGYYRYHYYPECTVVFKSGDTRTFAPYDVFTYEGTEYELSISDDQEDGPWDVGVHTAYVSFMGFETTFTVEITESIISAIYVQDVSISEGSDGYYDYDYDAYGNQVYWYRYQPGPSYTVLFSDGTSETYEDYDSIIIGEEYYRPDFVFDQSYDNQWGVGEYSATASLMGVTAEFTVEITESPIVALYVEDVSIIEKSSGGYNSDGDESWYQYFYSSEVTALLKDGSTATGYTHGITIDDVNYDILCVDDQSSETPWNVGEHTVTLKHAGMEATFTVEITESPVLGAVFADVELYQELNSFKNTRYNPETEEVEEYDHYYFIPECTVLLNDGTVLKSQNGYINYNDEIYLIDYNDSQLDDPWSVGERSVFASILGYEGSINVTVKENPYNALKISGETELILEFTKKSGGVDRFEITGFEQGLMSADGRKFLYVTNYEQGEVDITDIDKELIVTIGDLTSNTLVGNTFYKAWCVGVAVSSTMEIYLEHENWEGYIIGIHDGYDGQVTEENAADLTTLAVWICESYMEWYNHESAVINGFNCWLIDREDLSRYMEDLFGISDFDFTKSKLYDPSNPDKIPVYEQMAGGRGGYSIQSLNFVNGNWIFEDTTDHLIFDGLRVTMDESGKVLGIETGIKNESVASVSIEVISMPTKTEYGIGEALDTSGLSLKVVYSDGSEKIIESGFKTVGYDSETAGTKTVTVVYEELETTFEVVVVEGEEEEILCGDTDGDGKLTPKDVLALRKSLGGVLTLSEEQKLAADCDGDGKLTPKDVLALRKYLGGVITELPV